MIWTKPRGPSWPEDDFVKDCRSVSGSWGEIVFVLCPCTHSWMKTLWHKSSLCVTLLDTATLWSLLCSVTWWLLYINSDFYYCSCNIQSLLLSIWTSSPRCLIKSHVKCKCKKSLPIERLWYISISKCLKFLLVIVWKPFSYIWEVF